MNNLEKTFEDILIINNSDEYLYNDDKLFELEVKCNWLNNKIIEIKNSAKIKKLIYNREREL